MALVYLGIFLIFIAAVAKFLWDKDRQQTAERSVPRASVLMDLDMLHGLLDELDERDRLRVHSERLRLGMMALVAQWPAEFGEEALAVARELIEETAEVMP